MDENEVVSLADTEADDYSADISDDDIAKSWNDTSDEDETDETPDEQTEADPPKTEKQEEAKEPVDNTAEPEKPLETDLSFELKHLGEVKKVNKDEAVVLAQKGLDYDRIHGKYDEIKTSLDKQSPYIEFLESIAKAQNMTIEQLIDETNVKAYMDKGYDETFAREKVAFDKEKKQIEAVKAKSKTETDTKATAEAQEAAKATERARQIKEFQAEYTDIKPDSIPDEVWKAVAGGKTLLSAYQAYDLAQAKAEKARIAAELEAERKNKDNAKKSTGSRSSVGNKTNYDPIEDDWRKD